MPRLLRSLTARIVIAVLGTLLISLVAFMATFLAMSGPANVRTHSSISGAPDRGRDRHVAATRARTRQQAFIARLDQSLGATHYLTDTAGRDLITGEDRRHCCAYRGRGSGRRRSMTGSSWSNPRATAATG